MSHFQEFRLLKRKHIRQVVTTWTLHIREPVYDGRFGSWSWRLRCLELTKCQNWQAFKIICVPLLSALNTYIYFIIMVNFSTFYSTCLVDTPANQNNHRKPRPPAGCTCQVSWWSSNTQSTHTHAPIVVCWKQFHWQNQLRLDARSAAFDGYSTFLWFPAPVGLPASPHRYVSWCVFFKCN